MKLSSVDLLMSAIMLIAATCPAMSEDRSSHTPQPRLEQWINIDWSLGPDLPQGFQDSDGGILGSQLITTCGFCSGGLPEGADRH